MRRVSPAVPLLFICVSTLLVATPYARCEGAIITAEFPSGMDGASAAPFQVEPPGRYITITNLFDNRITWDPDDGSISVYEARIYARNATGENVVSFWPGFGKITIGGIYFDLHSPEDIFNGNFQVMCNCRWAKGGDFRKTFFSSIMQIDGDGSEVRDCFFGLDWDRQTPLEHGGYVDVNASNCLVHDNVFAAGGIWLDGDKNHVYGNYIGVWDDGKTLQGELPSIGITDSGFDNAIGCKQGSRNVIVAKTAGILLKGKSCWVHNNIIGRNSSGHKSQYGIKIESPGEENGIGGRVGAEFGPNLISHFTDSGIYIGEGCNRNQLAGNYIGVDKDGVAVRCGDYGVVVGPNTSGNIVGEPHEGYRNWIGGQKKQAILVEAGTSDLRIQSNYIGFSGTDQRITRGDGISIVGASDVLIGGRRDASAGNKGNIIGGCDGSAIELDNCTGVTIQGNHIGVGPDLGTSILVGGCGILAKRCANLVIGEPSEQPSASSAELSGKLPPSKSVGNSIRNTLCGIHLKRTSNVEINGNYIRDNSGSGVLIDGSLGKARNIWVGDQSGGTKPNIIVDNGTYGVEIRGRLAMYNKVMGNMIGFEWSGAPWTSTMIPRGNKEGGVRIVEAHDNRIGDAGKASCNLIAANGGPGVILSASAYENDIAGNIIGRSAAPDILPGNRRAGVLIDTGAHDNTVGGDSAGEANWVAGNRGWGIRIEGSGTDYNHIQRCYVGVNGAGFWGTFIPQVDPNDTGGVVILGGAKRNTIGDEDASDYPVVVSGNRNYGVRITGTGTDRNRVRRCRIGTRPNGASSGDAWGNGGPGVAIMAGARNNVIGGVAGWGNQISNNHGPGVYLVGSNTKNNEVLGNLIGTRADGKGDLGNDEQGVLCSNAPRCWIGMARDTTAAGNVISGNDLEGVLLGGKDVAGSRVAYNLVGTDKLGEVDIRNGSHGVVVEGGAHLNVIGPSNTISGNAGNGVVIWGVGSDDNEVRGNTIGLDKSRAKMMSNGKDVSLNGCGVLVRSLPLDAGKGPGPARTLVRDNWIYSNQRGIWFLELPFGADYADLPTLASRAVGNKIGYTATGDTESADEGIAVGNCWAYLLSNDIRGCKFGVQAAGVAAYAALNRNHFAENRTHVKLTENAFGMLGDFRGSEGSPSTTDPNDWDYGGNVFGQADSLAINAYQIPSARVLMTENCDWGVTTEAAIENLIRFPEGDGTHSRVDYSPVMGGVAPTSLGIAGVCGLSAQPTAQGVAITFTLSSDAAVGATVCNLAGRPVRTLCAAMDCASGRNTLLWNAVSDQGVAVPNGPYLVEVTARTHDGGEARALAQVRVLR